MDRLLRVAFEKLVRAGNLRVSTAGGSTFTFGDGTGRPVAIRFTRRAAEGRVLIDPELRFGEAYMDGGVVVEQGSIADFLDVTVKNLNRIQPNAWSRSLRTLRSLSRRVFQGNTLWRARRNAVHHYNIDYRIYRLFLDSDLLRALITKTKTLRSTTRNSPRSATLPPSCCCGPASRFSTSEADGAGSISILHETPRFRLSASTYPTNR